MKLFFLIPIKTELRNTHAAPDASSGHTYNPNPPSTTIICPVIK
jgi:hypothetical protein